MKHAQRPPSSVTIVSKGAILLAIVLLIALYPLAQGGIAKDLTITVIHANNVNGYLFPCPT